MADLRVHFDNEPIILDDVMDDSPEKFRAELRATSQGISVTLYRPGDTFPFASVHIENKEGTPTLYYWLTEDMDMDPTKIIELDEQIDDSYCLKCGRYWDNHNDDGSCVEG